jgi:hypothetical protein
LNGRRNKKKEYEIGKKTKEAFTRLIFVITISHHQPSRMRNVREEKT